MKRKIIIYLNLLQFHLSNFIYKNSQKIELLLTFEKKEEQEHRNPCILIFINLYKTKTNNKNKMSKDNNLYYNNLTKYGI